MLMINFFMKIDRCEILYPHFCTVPQDKALIVLGRLICFFNNKRNEINC